MMVRHEKCEYKDNGMGTYFGGGMNMQMNHFL